MGAGNGAGVVLRRRAADFCTRRGGGGSREGLAALAVSATGRCFSCRAPLQSVGTPAADLSSSLSLSIPALDIVIHSRASRLVFCSQGFLFGQRGK